MNAGIVIVNSAGSPIAMTTLIEIFVTRNLYLMQ